MLEEYREGIYKCGRCGQCVVGEYGYVCPVQQHTGGFEHYVARGRMAIARAMLEGTLTYSPSLVDAIYSCLLCGSCREQCSLFDPMTGEKLVDTIEITKAMRQDIVRAGLGPPPLMKEMDSNIERYHYFYGEVADRPELAAWADELNLPKKCDKSDLLYFAGCSVSYFSETAKATVGILKQAGIDVAYLGEDEWCCGAPALHSGNIAMAEGVMKHNATAIEQAGAKRVVTWCPACYHTLKNEYPKLLGKLPFEVVHSSEIINDMIKEGKIKLTEKLEDITITYHDPCLLGRYEQIYDPPREIIASISGVKCVEMPRNRIGSWCCGGGVATSFPDMAAEIAEDRVREAKNTGAEALVTMCPLCITTLLPAAMEAGIEVYDLSALLEKAMGLKT